jgi:hypothetical protein
MAPSAGMMEGPLPEKPTKRPVGDDEYYSANAKLIYYRDLLNNKLKEKDQAGYDSFFGGLGATMRKDPSKRNEYVEQTKYEQYLTPDEIKGALGSDYEDYVSTISTIRDKGFSDDKVKKLFGEKEIEAEPASLLYGKRFATMPVVTSFSRTTKGESGSSTVEDIYNYNPKTKKVDKISVKK